MVITVLIVKAFCYDYVKRNLTVVILGAEILTLLTRISLDARLVINT